MHLNSSHVFSSLSFHTRTLGKEITEKVQEETTKKENVWDSNK